MDSGLIQIDTAAIAPWSPCCQHSNERARCGIWCAIYAPARVGTAPELPCPGHSNGCCSGPPDRCEGRESRGRNNPGQSVHSVQSVQSSGPAVHIVEAWWRSNAPRGCCRAGPREGNSQVPRRMYLDAGLRCHGDLDQWYQYNPPNKPAPRPSGTA